MSKKRILLISITVIAGILLIFGLVNSIEKEEPRWQKAKLQKVKETFTVSGNVEAINESNLRAPLAGKILEVFVEEGDKVLKGELLAQYETDIYENQYKASIAKVLESDQNYKKLASGFRKEDIFKAKANYKAKKAILEEKQLYYEKIKNDEIRNKKLFEKKMLTPKEYQDYIKDLQISQAALESEKSTAQAALNDYEIMINGYRKEDIQAAMDIVNQNKAKKLELESIFNKTKIKSPINGTITNKFINPGDNLTMGDEMFNIYDKSMFNIKALIEEEDIRNVKLNDEVKIVLDAYPNQSIKGKIVSIYDKVEESTRLLPVKIKVAKIPDTIKILPGMTTSCFFSGHEVNYLTVPKGSLQREGKKFFLETRQGKIYIEVGKEQENRVIVKGKITPGEEVLVK